MLIIFILAVAGLLWLAHRFSLLLALPIETSIKNLSIPIPKVPLISVDKVTDTSIVFHWTDVCGNSNQQESNHSNSKIDKKETKDAASDFNRTDSTSKISHYILYINGIETVTINGREQKCTLESLQPGSNYQINLVAFNGLGFRSRSSPIFIKTSAKPIKTTNFQSLENPDTVIKYLLHEQERASLTKNDTHNKPTNRSRSGTLDGHSPNGFSIGHQHNENSLAATATATTAKHPHLIDDINELKWMLESGLEEVQSLMNSYRESEMEFEDEEITLISARNEAKKRRKYEDNNRTNLRQEIKLLEEQRVKGTNRISIDKKKINERLKKIDNYTAQIKNWEIEIENMKEEKEYISKETPHTLKRLKQEIENLNKEIFSSQSEVHETEDDLRDEINLRKSLESQKAKVIELFENINKNIDDITGLLGKNGLQYLNELFELKPQWKDELNEQIVLIDEKAQSDYKALQHQEWVNFNKMKNEIEEQRKNNNVLSSQLNLGLSSNNTESNSTTATNTTNVNGYLYHSLSKSNSHSIPSFTNQSFNNNSIRNIVRPRVTASGSFQGSDMLADQLLNRTDSKPSENNDISNHNNTNTNNINNNSQNTNSNLWSMNLGLDSSNNSMIEPTSVNMLLPQNLIEGEDFTQLFETQSKNQLSGDISGHMSLSQSVGLTNPSSVMPPTNSPSVLSKNADSPNVSSLKGFDIYQNNGINGLAISPPHDNKITSLSALTSSANNQNNILPANSQMNLLRSPRSNMLDLSQVTTTSPFNSTTPMNLSLNGINTSQSNSEIPSVSLFLNTNTDKTNDNPFSKIFESLSNSNNNTLDHNSTDGTAGMDFSISRARSSSFGSSIWSNGNRNGQNGNSNWGNLNTGNGFSFLGDPISMTAAVENNASAVVEDNGNNGGINNGHTSSPSFIKNMMGKFGSSPSKTLSNKTVADELEEAQNDVVEDRTNPGQLHSRTHSYGNSGHHKNSSFGSSRFFKLPRKNSVVSGAVSEGSNNSANGVNSSANLESGGGDADAEQTTEHNISNNSGVGFMGRKLSFAFKREKE